MQPCPPPLLHIVRVHRVCHPRESDAGEARGRAGLDGGGAAEEDEPRAVALGGRDGGERVTAPEARGVLPHALPPLHLPVRRRRHHPRALPRRPHPLLLPPKP